MNLDAADRRAFYWLLVAQCLVVAAHGFHLPWLVIACWLIAAVWRVAVAWGLAQWPGTLMKVLLCGAVIGSIWRGYPTWYGLDPAAALLIGAFVLKLLELRTRRDFYLLASLSFFVIATRFLFSQDLGLSFYLLVCALVTTASLVALQTGGQGGIWLPLGRASLMVAQSVPLVLVMYLVFPRIAPFWHVPMPQGVGQTGLGEDMTVGDISKLTRSGGLAFQVTFSDPVPLASTLYWRALILDNFDGRTWSRSGLTGGPASGAATPSGIPLYQYKVSVNPTYRTWLFAIPDAYSRTPNVERDLDGNLALAKPVNQRFTYEVDTFSEAEPSGLRTLSQFAIGHYTRLPARGNPKARRFAKDLRAANSDASGIVDAMLTVFRQQPFYYTLEPPALGSNTVDDFLFGTRRGFCEHYANAMAFVLRSAGVPARVAVGYQGGVVDPRTNVLSVHQYDAHAWVEAWLDGRWQSIDPTAAVSPDRITQGSLATLGEAEGFAADSGLSILRRGFPQLWRRMVVQYDHLNYLWHQQVLNFDSRRQEDVLKQWLGGLDAWRLVLMVMAGFVLLVVPFMLRLWWQASRVGGDPSDLAYREYCRRLAQAGLPLLPGETPVQYANRIAELHPDLSGEVWAITSAYIALRYEGESLDVKALERLVSRFRPRIQKRV